MKMLFLLTIQILTCSYICVTVVCTTDDRLAKVLYTIAKAENAKSNIMFLHDNSDSRQDYLADMLIKSETPATVMEISWLKEFQETKLPFECPAFVQKENMTDVGPIININENDIFKRPQLLPYDMKAPLTFIIWASKENIDAAISIFDRDVMWCKQKVDMGLLVIDNNFLFVSKDRNDMLDLFKSDTYLSNHPKVAAISQTTNHFVFWNRNHFPKTSHDFVKVKKRIPIEDLEEVEFDNIFKMQRGLNGKTINVLNFPVAYMSMMTNIDEPESNFKSFKDRWGISISILEAMQEALDFKVEYWNPDPAWDWGNIAEDGSWTGGIGLLHSKTCDITLEFSNDFANRQVMDQITYNYPDYESFASPLPYPKTDYLAIVLPFESTVWVCIGLSVVLVSLINYFLAHFEGPLRKIMIRPWMSLGGSFWYSFGTMLGESITRDVNMVKINTLRLSIISWMLYCFIVGASYSSSLKSHMTTPTYVKSLTTLEEIVNGHLPWKYQRYYVAEEDALAAMTDEVHKKLWDNKITLSEYDVPMYDVQHGEAVRFDWLSGLKLKIAINHTASNGKILVHLGSEPVLSIRYTCVLLRPDFPWTDQFVEFYRRIDDSGLVSHWEAKVFRQLRNQDQSPTAPVDQDKDECDLAEEGSCPLKLEHYYTSLILSAIMYLAALIIFASEKSIKDSLIFYQQHENNRVLEV